MADGKPAGLRGLSAEQAYEAGYANGESSLIADIDLRFETAESMDGLLEFFRRMTGDPELEWPGRY
jgi:hypothetical protein